MDAIKIKKGLGRGLSSLIGDTKIEKNINKLKISDLTRNKYQPRKIFEQESLEELTNSIRERGIIQPIIVRKSAARKAIAKLRKIAKFPLGPWGRNCRISAPRAGRRTINESHGKFALDAFAVSKFASIISREWIGTLPAPVEFSK